MHKSAARRAQVRSVEASQAIQGISGHLNMPEWQIDRPWQMNAKYFKCFTVLQYTSICFNILPIYFNVLQSYYRVPYLHYPWKRRRFAKTFPTLSIRTDYNLLQRHPSSGSLPYSYSSVYCPTPFTPSYTPFFRSFPLFPALCAPFTPLYALTALPPFPWYSLGGPDFRQTGKSATLAVNPQLLGRWSVHPLHALQFGLMMDQSRRLG